MKIVTIAVVEGFSVRVALVSFESLFVITTKMQVPVFDFGRVLVMSTMIISNGSDDGNEHSPHFLLFVRRFFAHDWQLCTVACPPFPMYGQ